VKKALFLKRIYFTVTNDLTYDQRMIRICRSLANAGFLVTLVGRKLKEQLPLKQEPFTQKRLGCLFQKGPFFYLEFNIHLFFYLLTQKVDGICAIDLDTIIPCLLVSKIRKIPRIYDAHELFSEMKEVLSRPFIKKVWTRIEKWTVPRFSQGYSVSQGIVEEFKQRYGVSYWVIRNLPVLEALPEIKKTERFILYQGAVNEARGLEFLIPSMLSVDCPLLVCGDGNFMGTCKSLIAELGLEKKISLLGKIPPVDLKALTQKAFIGINLVEPFGLNQYYSLANKFFDYIHAGIPQISMNFPEYEQINAQYRVAVLINDLSTNCLVAEINNLLLNDVLYKELQANCLEARSRLSWQDEEKKLILFYNKLFS
jgi:glycosyltransferase involved in cell wall biosynthesis